MISQAQKIDCRAFVGEKYFRFFRNRIFQQNQLSRLTPDMTPDTGFIHNAPEPTRSCRSCTFAFWIKPIH